MGKVTTYCKLSGCTPEVADILETINLMKDDDEHIGPLVLEAVQTMIDAHERKGIEDVTVICVLDEVGRPFYHRDLDKQEVLRLPYSSLRIIPHCHIGELYAWDLGSVSLPDWDATIPEEGDINVSMGPHTMIQSASIPILHLATGGRMTLQRFWRLLMYKGFPEGFCLDGVDGIDYGEISDCQGQFPYPIPGLSITELIALEKLGDVEIIQKTIIHQGKFWVWMRPDRFPLSGQSPDSFEPSVTQPPSTTQCPSEIEALTVEILVQIASSVSLQSLLSFSSASRHLRFKLLGFKSDSDSLARAWIQNNAPWYIPDLRDNSADERTTLVNTDTKGIGWAYLRRCIDNPSMMNRKRIWGIAQQLERMADDVGVR